MSSFKRSVSFFLSLPLALILGSPTSNCPSSNCTTMVTFPFRTTDQPPTCGLPGFDLSCGINKPLLTFPSSNKTFSLDSIDYNSKIITLSDPEGCLQEKLHGLDTWGTPFRLVNYTFFYLYNCSRSKTPYFKIACLSGSNYSVVVLDESNSDAFLVYGCLFVGIVKGPGIWTSYRFNSADSVDMTYDLPLGCQSCDDYCQRDPNNLTAVTCSYSSSATATIVRIVLGSCLLLVIICFFVLFNNNRRNINTTERRNLEATSIINTDTQSSGLEQGTLDAYPMIVLGGSGRMLVDMEDKTCPICLSEYEIGETLKSLPECLHRFHANCIDEWLRVKALCPICRGPLPPTVS